MFLSNSKLHERLRAIYFYTFKPIPNVWFSVDCFMFGHPFAFSYLLTEFLSSQSVQTGTRSSFHLFLSHCVLHVFLQLPFLVLFWKLHNHKFLFFCQW